MATTSTTATPATSSSTAIMASPEDAAQSSSLAAGATTAKPASGKQQDVKKEDAKEDHSKGSSTNAQPLAPPSKPAQQGAADTPDYFNGGHSNSHFSLEPNPFEQSFGNPSTETPGKFAGLPSVASLTSPAPIGPGGTPSWQNSLRSGPLSPAMLQGPTPSNGYFDESFRNTFPTPNESSLRTGLTPGGSGSMFPAPSPGSQAIFQSLQTGGATPGTLDFHRSAMNAAARSKSDATKTTQSSTNSNSAAASTAVANGSSAPNTTGPASTTNGAGTTAMAPNVQGVNKDYQPAQQHASTNPYANPSESDAASSLFMLANTANRNNQFAVPNQPPSSNPPQNASPTSQRSGKQSVSSLPGVSDYVGSEGEDGKGPARGKGKKGAAAAAKNTPANNGRRKAEDAPGKQPATKKAKASAQMPDENDDDDSDMDADSMSDMKLDNGQPMSSRKMTDEEKRKNFLERNRVAALKCRQRKKQWLQNLQAKVEIFSTENEALNASCAQLRDEIQNLKTLLMAHKDCPISHSQGLGGNNMAQVLGGGSEFSPHGGVGYGMMPRSGQMMSMQAGTGMQRR